MRAGWPTYLNESTDMSREDLKQRIQYLIEHGGIYPETVRDHMWWVVLGLLVAIAGMELLQLLR